MTGSLGQLGLARGGVAAFAVDELVRAVGLAAADKQRLQHAALAHRRRHARDGGRGGAGRPGQPSRQRRPREAPRPSPSARGRSEALLSPADRYGPGSRESPALRSSAVHRGAGATGLEPATSGVTEALQIGTFAGMRAARTGRSRWTGWIGVVRYVRWYPVRRALVGVQARISWSDVPAASDLRLRPPRSRSRPPARRATGCEEAGRATTSGRSGRPSTAWYPV